MPIYEYRCADCEQSFEAFVRSASDHVANEDLDCPHCHGSKLTREMSTFAARGGSNGDAAGAVAQAMSSSGGAGRMSGGGCCGGGCGCH